MSLKGLRIVITTGPTREMWDTIRYLSNISSGKLGFAIAKKAFQYGAEVTLISAFKDHNINGIRHISIVSALDMFEAVKNAFDECDIFISAAAVADFRPVRSAGKIEKKEGIPVIKLERNPDILKWAGDRSKGKLLVGFSVGDTMDMEEGMRKKKAKNCQIMVVNTVKNMGSTSKTFNIIMDTAVVEYMDLSLEESAEVILKECRKLIKN